jgi:hypothetical protein
MHPFCCEVQVAPALTDRQRSCSDASMAMAIAFAVILALHGLVHLIGAAKGLGWAEMPSLTQAVSPGMGVVWLAASGLLASTAVLLFMASRWWWLVGSAAVVLSALAMASSWADSKFGAPLTALAAVGVAYGFLGQGPASLRAEYDRDVARLLADPPQAALVTDADLATLSHPLQRYLRLVGVVSQPRVHTFRVRMHGRMRSGRTASWMTFTAEQHNRVDPHARLFYMEASLHGLPAQAYHRYVDGTASMRVKAAALVPVVTQSGPLMTESETVTLFNDLCVMAPAALLGQAVTWRPVDSRTTDAVFTNAGHTVRARLTFNDAGALIDFVSDDRSQIASDGTLRRVRWSTPLGSYRTFDQARLTSGGEARWHEPEDHWTYIEVTLDEVRYNPAPPC